MASKIKKTTEPTAELVIESAPEATAPIETQPTETESLAVSEEVLKGIFMDDPKGKYFSKDGETFLNEEQFEKLADQSGFATFQNHPLNKK